MIVLKDWKIEQDVWSAEMTAEGHVEGHYGIEDGKWIVTSRVVSIKEDAEEEFLHLHTESGSHYKLYFREVNMLDVKETCDVLEKQGISEDVRRILLKYAEEKRTQAIKEIELSLAPQELHLVFLGDVVRLAFWKNTKGEFGEVRVAYHNGNMKNSVLVMDYTAAKVDFRYFPEWGEIQPYSWSEDIKAVIVDNRIAMRLRFFGPREKGRYKECPGRVCTRITKEEYLSEDFGESVYEQPMLTQGEINWLLGGGKED